jgi:hypothetical protein
MGCFTKKAILETKTKRAEDMNRQHAIDLSAAASRYDGARG